MTWQEAWNEGRTPWDAGTAHPSLQALVTEDRLPAGRALIPGAGSAYEAHLLARAGWDALAVDIAPDAVTRALELWTPAGEGRFDAVVADFFQLEPDAVGGRFDVIWDYTFLCAIEPDRRDQWSQRMRHLLAEGGALVTLIFPVLEPGAFEAKQNEGPPYPMRPELVRELVEGWADCEVLCRAGANHEGREGMEWLGIWRHRPSTA